MGSAPSFSTFPEPAERMCLRRLTGCRGSRGSPKLFCCASLFMGQGDVRGVSLGKHSRRSSRIAIRRAFVTRCWPRRQRAACPSRQVVGPLKDADARRCADPGYMVEIGGDLK